MIRSEHLLYSMPAGNLGESLAKKARFSRHPKPEVLAAPSPAVYAIRTKNLGHGKKAGALPLTCFESMPGLMTVKSNRNNGR